MTTMNRRRKRKLSYFTNILIMSDPKHPEHEGKVFLFRFGNDLVPLIMDAKNYHVGNRPSAKRTMIVYLAELDYLNPSCGILLFPTYSRTGVPPTKNKPLKEYDEIVIGSKFPEEYRKYWSIIEANFVPSRKTEDKLVRKEILNKIYEILQQYIAPVPEITS